MIAAAPRPFAAEVALLIGARLSTVAALFGINVIGARLLTPEALGAASVGQTVGMIAALVANGGINIATIYFLRQDPDGRSELVPRLVALAVGAATVTLVLVLAAAPIVLGWVVPSDAVPLLVASGVLGAGIVVYEFAGALLLGFGRSGWFTVLEVVRGAGALAGVTILLAGPWRDAGGFVAGLVAGYALASLLGFLSVARAGLSVRPRIDAPLARRALRFGIRGQVGNVFQFLGVRLDLILVPALLDLRAAGIYVIAVRTSDVVGQIATATSSLVFPRVADPSEAHRTQLTERALRMTLVVVAATSLLLAVAGEAILRLAFGEPYADGGTALIVLLAAGLPLAAGRVLAADLKGRGRPGLVSWASLASVGATIVLDLALIPRFGIVGAALASLAAYAITAVALALAYRSVTGGRIGALLPTVQDVRDLVAAGRQLVRRGMGGTH